MSYLVIEDFKLGMDRRKARISGSAGALWSGINGHVTRGGDFERRKKFVAKYTLPAGLTFGLATVSGQLFVFGSGATPGSMPAGVNYQRNQHTAAAVMNRLLDSTAFSGNLYTVSSFDNGDVFHYYNGSRVTSWDSIAASVASNNAVATELAARIDREAAFSASAVGAVVTITAATAGTPYTISASTVNGGTNADQTLVLAETQANRVAVSEVLSKATFTVTGGTASAGVNRVTSITVDGVEILNVAVDWTTSHSATATAIAAQINSYNSTPEYTATAVGADVIISAAAGTGAGPNGFIVNVTEGGNVTTSPASPVFANGVTAVTAQAQITTATVGGTFEAADTFTITLNGTNYTVSGAASGTGTDVLTYSQKIYSVTNSLLYFCALNNPNLWGSGTGNGFINMANQNEGNETLVCSQEYQNLLAIFSRNSIRLWQIDVDPALNLFKQTVQNTGTQSPKSVVPYGNIDLFYLHDSGIRSLRARDSSNAPAVNDVGVAIDSFVLEYLATLSEAQVQRAIGIIEPIDGRYWLAVGKRIFVFSFFPGSKINAWTYYDLSSEIGANDISDMVRIGNRVYLRAGDVIYLYGGDANNTYPSDGEIEADVILPFLSAGTPATFKGISGFDFGIEGTWIADLLPDPARPNVELRIGTFAMPTFSIPQIPVQMPTAMFALRFRCNKAGYARVTNAAVHYVAQEAK